MALIKDPITGKIVPAPPVITMTPPITEEKKEPILGDPTKVDVALTETAKTPSTPKGPVTIAKQNPVVANLPKEVQSLVERETTKRLEFAGSVDRSSILARIKVVLGQQGMDSQQQEKALHQIREILEG